MLVFKRSNQIEGSRLLLLGPFDDIHDHTSERGGHISSFSLTLAVTVTLDQKETLTHELQLAPSTHLIEHYTRQEQAYHHPLLPYPYAFVQ